jgi:hypothetical protein
LSPQVDRDPEGVDARHALALEQPQRVQRARVVDAALDHHVTGAAAGGRGKRLAPPIISTMSRRANASSSNFVLPNQRVQEPDSHVSPSA